MANPKSKLSKFGCGNKKTLSQSPNNGTDSYQELVIQFLIRKNFIKTIIMEVT